MHSVLLILFSLLLLLLVLLLYRSDIVLTVCAALYKRQGHGSVIIQFKSCLWEVRTVWRWVVWEIKLYLLGMMTSIM